MLPIVPRTVLFLCLAGSAVVISRPARTLRADDVLPPAVVETVESVPAAIAAA